MSVEGDIVKITLPNGDVIETPVIRFSIDHPDYPGQLGFEDKTTADKLVGPKEVTASIDKVEPFLRNPGSANVGQGA